MSVDRNFTVNVAHSDWSWRVGDGALRLHRHGPVNGEFYWTGSFLDPRGTCTVYRQADHSRIDFVHCGRCYSRSWPRYWGDRTVARLARALVGDVLAGAMTR